MCCREIKLHTPLYYLVDTSIILGLVVTRSLFGLFLLSLSVHPYSTIIIVSLGTCSFINVKDSVVFLSLGFLLISSLSIFTCSSQIVTHTCFSCLRSYTSLPCLQFYSFFIIIKRITLLLRLSNTSISPPLPLKGRNLTLAF